MKTVNVLESSTQEQALERLMDESRKAMLKNENRISADLVRMYNDRVNALIKDLEGLNYKFLSGENPTYGDWQRLRLDQQSYQLIYDSMGSLKKDIQVQFSKDLVSFYQDTYNRTAWAVDQASLDPIQINYKVPPDAFVEQILSDPWQGAMFSERLGLITDSMAMDIQKQLALSMTQGDSTADMAQKIRDFIGIDDDEMLKTRPRASKQLYRANMISRTEMMRAANLAAEHFYSQNNELFDGLIWSAKPGLTSSGVCEDCADRDEMTQQEIIDEFGEGEDEMPYHPNCRCVWRPEMKDQSKMIDDAFKDAASKLPVDRGAYDPNDVGSFNFTFSDIQDYDSWIGAQ